MPYRVKIPTKSVSLRHVKDFLPKKGAFRYHILLVLINLIWQAAPSLSRSFIELLFQILFQDGGWGGYVLWGGDRGHEPGSPLGGKGSRAVQDPWVRNGDRNTFSVKGNVNPSERSAACLEIRYLRLEISKCDNRTQQQGSVVLLIVPQHVAMEMEKWIFPLS